MSEVVDEIKEKIDIADIIGEHVTLKKAGKNLRGLCPFHGEKTPSFMVSPDLQIFKCFGCGESGDVFTFLQKYEGLDFPQTLSLLAEKTGVKLTSSFDQKNSQKEKLYKVHEKVAQFYQYILLKHPSGKKALDYLLTERGLDQETIKTFGIGFSPDVAFALKEFVVTRNKVPIKLLQDAGIVYSRGSTTFDRFRGRIIFPLHDHIGRVVGFSGRLMPGAKKDLAKYINSPETEIYHKSKVLFGLNITKNTIKKTESAVLTEGELDMISSWKVGVRNVVAIKGSALTKDHIILLSRFTKTVCFAFDNDSAGIKAIQRGIELIHDHEFVVKVAQLGEYKDPDEAAQKDPSGYKKAIDTAIPLWDFLIQCIFDKYEKKGALKMQLISAEVTPLLASIEDDIVQSHYAQMVASRLDVSVESVLAQAAKLKKTSIPQAPFIAQESHKVSTQELLEESLLASALHLKDKSVLTKEVYEYIHTPKYKRIYENLLVFLEKNHDFDLKTFSDEIPKELTQTVVDLAFAETSFPDSEYEGQFDDSLSSLKKIDIKHKIKSATEALSRLDKHGSKKELSDLKVQLNNLIHDLSKIEKK